jgi:peroxiredoxin
MLPMFSRACLVSRVSFVPQRKLFFYATSANTAGIKLNLIEKPTTLIGLKGVKDRISTADYFKNKKVLVIGVPGAFTPVCSTGHVPGYLKHLEDFKKKGIDKIAVVSVNDHYVMSAWAKDLKTEGKLDFFADPDGTFTSHIGQLTDLSAAGLGKRSKRYAMLVENGEVKKLKVEESPADLKVSAAEAILKEL